MRSRGPFRVLHRLPTCWEQTEALAELLNGPHVAPAEILEAIADEAHDKTGLPVDLPHPKLLAPPNAIDLVPVPGLPRLARVNAAGMVEYRRGAHRLRLAFALYHELAECLLARSRWPHTHADVQRLALMLMAPRSFAAPLLKRLGIKVAARFLIRRHRHAPAWALRVRLVMLVANGDEGEEVAA